MTRPEFALTFGSQSEPSRQDRGATGGKLASDAASRLEAEILGQGWAAGHRLGAEADVSRALGVSRPVARQAISIAEFDGLVETRRGGGGGVFVLASGFKAAASILQRYLDFCPASLTDFLSARRIIEGRIDMVATQAFDRSRTTELRSAAAAAVAAKGQRGEIPAAWALIDAVVETTGCATAALLMQVLAEVGICISVREGVRRDARLEIGRAVIEARHAQVEALIAGDLPMVAACSTAMFDQSAATLARSPRLEPPATVTAMQRKLLSVRRLVRGNQDRGATKLPEALAQLIVLDITRASRRPGDFLGLEADLLERYEVGRGVLLEALRPLERFGFVGMERGKGRGLRVASPRPDTPVDLALRCLPAQPQAERRFLRALFEALEIGGVEAAARQAGQGAPGLARRLAELAPVELLADVDIHGVAIADEAALVGLGGNYVIDVLARFCATASRLPAGPALVAEPGAYMMARADLLSHLWQGDVALARRCLTDLQRARGRWA